MPASYGSRVGRWEFLFTASPHAVPNGAGSAMNPIAVFQQPVLEPRVARRVAGCIAARNAAGSSATVASRIHLVGVGTAMIVALVLRGGGRSVC